MDTAAMIAKDKPDVALVPIGAYEQHGPHLPMTTDTVIACAIAHGLAERHQALRISPITISCSHEHSGFAGCIALSAATLGHVIGDIVEWVARNGIRLAVLVNGHGGNYVLGNIAQEANVDGPRVLVGPTREHWNSARCKAGIETRDEHDMHAGEIETSLLLHVWPPAVRPDLIADTPGEKPRVTTFYGVKHYTRQGVVGTPSKATEAKGKIVLETLIDEMADEIASALAHQDECAWSRSKPDIDGRSESEGGESERVQPDTRE